MAATMRKVEYFHVVVQDRPGEAYRLLNRMAAAGVNLLAFNAIPLGMEKSQLVLFPEDTAALARVAESEGLSLEGPHEALLVQGDDHLGALLDLHRRLSEAGLNVACSSGVTDGRGGFGYVVYLRQHDVPQAARLLGL